MVAGEMFMHYGGDNVITKGNFPTENAPTFTTTAMSEFQESTSITFEWTIRDLKTLFEST